MSSLSINLSSDYGYVLIAAASTSLLNLYLSLNVAAARRKAKIPYPNAYATSQEAEKDPLKNIFNCTVRAHLNTLENLPTFLTTLLIAGLKFPRISAILGMTWIFARIIYAINYSTGNPDLRRRGSWSFIPSLGITGLALYTGVSMIQK